MYNFYRTKQKLVDNKLWREYGLHKVLHWYAFWFVGFSHLCIYMYFLFLPRLLQVLGIDIISADSSITKIVCICWLWGTPLMSSLEANATKKIDKIICVTMPRVYYTFPQVERACYQKQCCYMDVVEKWDKLQNMSCKATSLHYERD